MHVKIHIKGLVRSGTGLAIFKEVLRMVEVDFGVF